jgi:ribosomal RNA-processing protein 36
VTSKRPVTRRRQVIEVPKLQVRDPRFQPLAGSGSSSGLDARAYEKSYGFLADLRAAEHMELRENLKRARKRLASSPRDLYEERATEVDRLEQALKRAESVVHKDRREKVDREALERAKRDEKEKRKQGKGAWHMRNCNFLSFSNVTPN